LEGKGFSGSRETPQAGINRVVEKFDVTTHVVRPKLFRLKAEGVGKARLKYFGGNI